MHVESEQAEQVGNIYYVPVSMGMIKGLQHESDAIVNMCIINSLIKLSPIPPPLKIVCMHVPCNVLYYHRLCRYTGFIGSIHSHLHSSDISTGTRTCTCYVVWCI